MITERAAVGQVNLYYDLYVPDEGGHADRPLVIALHGYEGNKESMMAKMRAINSADFMIASLQGPNGFFARDGRGGSTPKIGFGWMMQYKSEDTIRLHHQTVLAIIDAVDREYGLDRSAIFLVGFSQSVSLNYRFAFTHPGTIRGVVAVCGGIPGDWDQPKYINSNTDVLIIAGERDEFYPLDRTRTFKGALERRAKSVEFQSFSGGHVFPNEMLARIDQWLLARIAAVAR
jgi:predicted esterase